MTISFLAAAEHQKNRLCSIQEHKTHINFTTVVSKLKDWQAKLYRHP